MQIRVRLWFGLSSDADRAVVAATRDGGQINAMAEAWENEAYVFFSWSQPLVRPPWSDLDGTV